MNAPTIDTSPVPTGDHTCTVCDMDARAHDDARCCAGCGHGETRWSTGPCNTVVTVAADGTPVRCGHRGSSMVHDPLGGPGHDYAGHRHVYDPLPLVDSDPPPVYARTLR